jgi:hypothetical protein
MSYKLTSIALLVMALYTVGARADEDADTPTFSFNGYGTFGVTHSSEDKADFTASNFKPNGAGYSHSWSASVDSLIAGQVTAKITRDISAVLQVISEQNYDNSYRPHVEWANIKYQITPDFSIRAGRIVLPGFLVSDHRKVGYANPWVRPPIEVYNLTPLSNSDGVDASYRMHIGELTNTVQGSYGKNEQKIPGGSIVKVKGDWSISDTAEYGAATVHITYHQANLTLGPFKPLFDGFRQFGPEGVAIADKYDSNSKPITFIGLGGMYDPGSWFVMGEWGSANSDSAIGKRTAWYVSGGYRLGEFTPYVTYAQTKADNKLSDPGLTVSALPPFLTGPATGLNSALNSILSAKPVQNTISIGVRWDFMKNTDLKLQFDHTSIGDGSIGMLSNTQPGFQLGGKVNMLSATVDFVF